MSGEQFETVETIALIHDLEVPEVRFAVRDDAEVPPDAISSYPFWGVVSPTGEPIQMVTFLRSDVQDGSVTFPLYVTAIDDTGEVMPYNSPDGQTLTVLMDQILGGAGSAAMVDGKVRIPVTINVPDPSNLPEVTFDSVAVTTVTAGSLSTADSHDTSKLKCEIPKPDPSERLDVNKILLCNVHTEKHLP